MQLWYVKRQAAALPRAGEQNLKVIAGVTCLATFTDFLQCSNQMRAPDS